MNIVVKFLLLFFLMLGGVTIVFGGLAYLYLSIFHAIQYGDAIPYVKGQQRHQQQQLSFHDLYLEKNRRN
ncbi:hypothetical protein PP175_27765 (plasmid) [Aneurinibacillus sp. Ricciae_BoGa-3]|uniref:hypothetical protein n=1 Tax=Aneurinibacillus sp. Ricciae_BoGa-3 TaxID=3022697 RepID=UPI0023414775|nr:hypothetical protein [Aneurinibacillus sp. Ricciae_BoGa-3]WCK56991.1 hypothetical protein PP175_27765 [Aneurinibacillus sp. Ricciae_BoGa-3]